MDGEVGGVLSAPVAKTIAPTAIALTSIAITLVFIFHSSLAHELDVFNRLVTGHSHAVHQARSKAPVTIDPSPRVFWWTSITFESAYREKNTFLNANGPFAAS